MARIRSIKPEFWTSEQVMECSPIARLLFIGLWNFCDDGGNHVDSERTIKAEIFPGDDIGSADVRRYLDELSSNGLIVYYTHENKGYLHVTGWHHQKIDRPTFKLPGFSGADSDTPRRGLDESSPPEGRGEEGKGEEKEQSSLRSDSSPAAPADLLGDQPKPADLNARRAERLAAVTDDAIAAYNRMLGKPAGLLSSVNARVGRTKRQEQVRRMLQVASEICDDQFGDKRITPEFWEAYFGACAEDPFHSGRGPYSGQHANWRPDFEFLTRPAQVLKVFERATEDAA